MANCGFFLYFRNFTSAISIPRETVWLKRTKEQTYVNPSVEFKKPSQSYSETSYCVSRTFVSTSVSLLLVAVYAQQHAESIVRFVCCFNNASPSLGYQTQKQYKVIQCAWPYPQYLLRFDLLEYVFLPIIKQGVNIHKKFNLNLKKKFFLFKYLEK